MYGIENSYGCDMLTLSLIYAIFVFIIYHYKKKIHSFELKMFGYLIDVNLVACIFEMLCGITIVHLGINNIGTIIINKLYILILGLFNLLFFFYCIAISLSDEEVRKKFSKIARVIMGIYVVYAIFVIALPIELVNDYRGVFSTGPAVGCLLFVGVITICLSTYYLIHGVKKNKVPIIKYVPLILLSIGVICTNIFMSFNHHYTLLSVLETFSLLAMYFTIENPDVKVIEELEIAKDEAEKANRSKSDFLSSMSHEIRTPLNAIVGFSQDIVDRKEQSSEAINEDANYILDASKSLLEIIGNILDINKIESSKMEIVEDTYNYKEEVKALAKINSVRIGNKPISLNLNISEDIPDELIGDKDHVKEVVNNLLSNAIKYTDSGTIELNTRCINKNDECTLIISVSDTGRGIKEEQIEKLFSKFERIEEDRNTTVEGTGLGLAITKSLVELMGGKINVQSEFGKGSLFVVQLPQKISRMTLPKEEVKEVEVDEEIKEVKEELAKSETEENKETLKVIEEEMPVKPEETPEEVKEEVETIEEKEESKIEETSEEVVEDKDEESEVEEKDTKEETTVEEQEKDEKTVDEKKEEVSPEDKGDSSAIRVLVVDDNHLNIKVAQRILSTLKYDVDGVESGEECLEKVKTDSYNLILMDIMMPHMSGVETLHKLREDESFKTPVIAFTADAVAGAEENYLKEGFDDYISKPINIEDMKEKIQKIL